MILLKRQQQHFHVHTNTHLLWWASSTKLILSSQRLLLTAVLYHLEKIKTFCKSLKLSYSHWTKITQIKSKKKNEREMWNNKKVRECEGRKSVFNDALKVYDLENTCVTYILKKMKRRVSLFLVFGKTNLLLSLFSFRSNATKIVIMSVKSHGFVYTPK
jgi:hypothetical protein